MRRPGAEGKSTFMITPVTDTAATDPPGRGGWLVRPAALALVVSTLLAWAFVLYGPDGMGAGLVAFLAPWTAMMAAMMLPSAAPLVLLYRRGSSGAQTTSLVAGYVLVWALAGVPLYLAHMLLPMTVGPVALAVAGVYQFTPLKAVCLDGCRSPADFLVQRWGRSALRLGIEHGAWCLGCCWALMSVLVLTGAMGLAWVLGIAALVAVEKLTRRGALWARVIGIALLVAALIQGVMQWRGSSLGMS